MVMALAAEPRVDLHVRLDERSAGFTALGIGLATGRPAVISVTSGTAAAELHPAVVEADLARVPLIVCTADRPPELQGVGAPQTIAQGGLYGTAVRFEVDLGVADWAGRSSWRSLGSRLVAEALAGPRGPGPVQLNLPCREPLVGQPLALPPGRPEGAPWHQAWRPPVGGPGPVELLGSVLVGPDRVARSGLIVAGGGAGDPEAVLALAGALGWPVLADPRSGCRLDRPGVVAAADAILREPAAAFRLRPDVVIRLGAPWASKVVGVALEEAVAAGGTEILVDPHWAWADPDRRAAVVVAAEPGAWCRSVVAGLTEAEVSPSPFPWLAGWTEAEGAAQEAISDWCDAQRGVTEPGLARALVEALPAGASLVVSSSMPVRDVEWFGPARPDSLRVLANRGANGIDGVVSTALGVALTGGPVVALVGDLAFLHDLTALVRPAGFDPPLTVVVADNGGGGIFSFLLQAETLELDWFEALFGTPQAVDPAAAAAGLGIPVREVAGIEAFRTALEEGLAGGGLSVICVRLPERPVNTVLHQELQGQVGAALERLFG
jgi:2-succinyl-5-enolpyruvyl-6-hydroxy-3-cyclohexene-1-carboxylate synthase